MIGILKAVQGFKRLSGILGWVGGGLYKRIDENRELMELLRREAPDLVAQHPEIANWLQAHDDFFCELESAMPPSDMRFGCQAASSLASPDPGRAVTLRVFGGKLRLSQKTEKIVR